MRDVLNQKQIGNKTTYLKLNEAQLAWIRDKVAVLSEKMKRDLENNIYENTKPNPRKRRVAPTQD